MNSAVGEKMKILAFLACLLTSAPAFAQNLTGVGSTYWGSSETINTTTTCVTTSTSSSDCALFPAGTSRAHKGTVVVVTASVANMRCAFVGDKDLQLTGLHLSDPGGPNGSGPGMTFLIGAVGLEVNQKPSRTRLRLSPGYRAGLCETEVANSVEALIGVPCDGNGDCTGFTAGDCVTSPTDTQILKAGLFLVCESDGNANVVTVRKERIGVR